MKHCFPLSVATNGKGGHGLKLEKIGLTVELLTAEQRSQVQFPGLDHYSGSLNNSKGTFYFWVWFTQKVMTWAQNWFKTAISWWQTVFPPSSFLAPLACTCVHLFLVKPLNSKIKIWILICSTYSFPTEVEGRSRWKLISSKFILCDHVCNSHDHSVLQSIDITKRNLMLITLRALNLLRAGISHCTFVIKRCTPHTCTNEADSTSICKNKLWALKTVILIFCRLKKIQEKKKIMKQKAEAAKKARGITEG